MAMDDRDESLERLAGMLGGLADEGEPMTVWEMDGFVTGLVVYPEHVPPSEWLQIVWGADTEFRSREEAEAAASALIQHYNWVARTLAFEPERYGPVLEVVEGTDEVLWEAWIEGFARAMRLRPGAWARIEGSDELDVIECGPCDSHLVRGGERNLQSSGRGARLAGQPGADADRRDGAGSQRAQAITECERGRTARGGRGERTVREGGARGTVRLRFGACIPSLLRCALRNGRVPVPVRAWARFHTPRCRHQWPWRREPCDVDRVLIRGKGDRLLGFLDRKRFYFSDR